MCGVEGAIRLWPRVAAHGVQDSQASLENMGSKDEQLSGIEVNTKVIRK